MVQDPAIRAITRTTLNTAKTPIGIVFRVGCATEYGDNISYYRQKDGKTRFDEIKGYVVALQDASENGCWWSSFNDDKGCGCSTSTEDFRAAPVTYCPKEGPLHLENATERSTTHQPVPEIKQNQNK